MVEIDGGVWKIERIDVGFPPQQALKRGRVWCTVRLNRRIMIVVVVALGVVVVVVGFGSYRQDVFEFSSGARCKGVFVLHLCDRHCVQAAWAFDKIFIRGWCSKSG